MALSGLDTESGALVCLDMGRYHLDSGQAEGARAWLGRALAAYRAAGVSDGLHNAQWLCGCSFIVEARFADALRVLPTPSTSLPNMGIHCHVAWSDALRGAGDLQGAADHLRACERLIAEHNGLECRRDLLDAAWGALM